MLIPDSLYRKTKVWEFYHSKSQIEARTHPAALATQKFLLKLWHASNSSEVDFNTPLTYFDRLRIRYPGDNKVVLGWSSHRRDPLFKEVEQMYSTGPHIDGGSVERWEDPSRSHLTASSISRYLTGGI